MYFIKKSVDWIKEITDGENRKKLLDLGCGPGIYAELFAERGFDVTGIDISGRSIDYAKENTVKKRSNIKYYQKSYLEMEYSEEFDIIEVQPLTNDGYCQALIDKIFEISHSDFYDKTKLFL